MITDNDLEKLRTLQDILTDKIRLENEIQEIPRQLVALEEAHNRTRKMFIEKNLEYEKVKAAEEEARANQREAEAARERAESNMDKIFTTRELEALDKERLSAKTSEENFRKEVLQKEKTLAELAEQIKSLDALIKHQETELVEKKHSIDAEVSEKKKQAEILVKKEKKLTENLAEVAFKFERIIKNKKEGIVAIKGNVCMGCHMILPAQFSNDVRLCEDYIFCPYCSRILYYEESPESEDVFFDTEDSGALYEDEEDEEEEFEEDEKEEEKITNMDFDEA